MRSIEWLCAFLADGGFEHALIGGHAVNAHVRPRMTTDVDFCIDATPQELARLERELAAQGFRVTRSHGSEQASGPDFVRFVDDEQTTLEFQTAKTSFQRAVVSRATRVGPLRIATVEDLLVMKAIANRAKDQRDLDELAKLPDLDWSYVVDNARAWGVDGVIDAVRSRKT